MNICHIDFESRSTLDLRVVGLDNYARHPSTDVWCMGYALQDHIGEHAVSLLTREDFAKPNMAGVIGRILDGGLVVAHNASFELAIWNHILVPRYGWPELKPEQCICTMALAYSMALPGALENAAAAVGLEMQKDMAGHRLMLQMAKPRSEDPLTWWDDPDRLHKLFAYCKQDVEVERALHKRLISMTAAERAVWQLDYQINQRGIYVDRPAVEAAIAVVESEQKRLNDEMRRVTNNAVATCSAVGQLGDWIRYRGVTLPGVAKADVLDALAGDDLPADVRKALMLRQEAAKTSTAKLKKMVESASEDGRLRGMFQYHGAGTGRWAARKVQLHNLPRPKLKQPAIEGAISILDRAATPEYKARLIEMIYGPPLDTLASCLRGMLTAAPGHDLIAADFANIEGRGIAWLAGEEWKLQAFRDFDAGKGPDIYLITAGKIYNRPATDLNKTSPEREVGKRCELAFGYQGGLGAWRKFETYATKDYVPFPDDKVENIKTAWREAHPRIVKWWFALEEAALAAVKHPGQIHSAGPDGRQAHFRVNGSFLWCKLPSGRNLCYPYPKLKVRETPWGDMKEQIHYQTVDGQTNKWVETHTYGGKLAENITQAVARDLLAGAMLELEKRFYPIVLHVHDEAVVEVPEDAAEGTLHNIERIMKIVPPWAAGLPIAVESWRGKRYRK